MSKKVILSGGTGFIGQALIPKLLKADYTVVLLTRGMHSAPEISHSSLHVEQWDGRTLGRWAKHLEGAGAVINLAGESIGAKRWTQARKRLLLGSRLDSTKVITSAIAKATNKPSVLVNASAVGYYGNVDNDDVPESYPHGNDFLASLCVEWEQQALTAQKLGVRVALLRNGVVLGKNGGALKKMLLPFKMLVGGPLGSGRQWFSWIHLDDVVDIILFILEKKNISGPVNVASPNPVTMKQFCEALGKAMKRPCWAQVPALMLQTVLGEMSQVILTGQRVLPKKLVDAGYKFRYSDMDRALETILQVGQDSTLSYE